MVIKRLFKWLSSGCRVVGNVHLYLFPQVMVQVERIFDVDRSEPVLVGTGERSFLLGGDHGLTVVKLLTIKEDLTISPTFSSHILKMKSQDSSSKLLSHETGRQNERISSRSSIKPRSKT